MDYKSTYEKIFLTIQTAIRALQDINSLAKHWQTALSKSMIIFIRVFDTKIASIYSHCFQNMRL